MSTENRDLYKAASAYARPFNDLGELKAVIDRVKNARVVMLGESTHGTHEFYDWRSSLSLELIKNHGFQFIGVEGDWPPCQRLNEYVAGPKLHDASDGASVLEHFNRWPTWMWANTDILILAESLREANALRPADKRAGFHGLDVYSFFESMQAVIEELGKINPFLARMAKDRYSCFDPFQKDERHYAQSLFESPEGCRDQVVQTLHDLLQIRIKDLFDAQQNARIVANAENYYRTMVVGTEDSWNVRDRHMMETLDLLLERYGPRSKGIVWAHNTHIGDYRATEMVQAKQVNLGGLAREKYGVHEVALVGFGTDHGSVIASHAWDGAIQKMEVPRGHPGSYEAVLSEVAQAANSPRFYMVFDHDSRQGPLAEYRGHRAIGVVYDPRHERWGNYISTSMANRYDAFIFIDETRALEPLRVAWVREDIPEAWPSGQ